MPRTGRGGKRTGRPGTAYSNRSDLTQAPSAAPNQEYGKAAEQMRAQRQVPLPKQAVPSPSSPAQAGSAPPVSPPGGAAPVPPGGLGPLTAMTGRPNEPLTAGMPTGPGPGPEVLDQGGLSPLDEIRAMYAAYPSADLRRLIGYLEGL